MKTSLIARLSLLCLPLLLSATVVRAQKVMYTEAPIVATSGYWTLVTDQQLPDRTTVGFYNDRHELLYEEQLSGVYLNPTKSLAAHRRIARMLGATLQQVQRMQSNSMVSMRLAAFNRYAHRTYAAR